MQGIISFLKELSVNNERQWFNARKGDYLELKSRFDAIVMEVAEKMRSVDPSLGRLRVEDCTYRIYRDTRFSADKTPYKMHMGAFFAPGGKRSGYSGYYFQVGALEDGGFPDGCIIGCGDYRCEPEVLRILREDIDIDGGESFRAAISNAAPGFALDTDNMLKKVPRGYDAGHQAADLLRLRTFGLFKTVDHAYFTSAGFVDNLVSDLASTKPFVELINRAVAYSRHQ